MADFVVGMNKGQTLDESVVDTGDPGTDIYIVIDDTKNFRTEDILRHIDILKQSIFRQDDFN